MSEKKRLLTGDRPTGKLHLGHLVGSIRNRVRLQEQYDSFFLIADLHMLTTKNSPDDIAQVDKNAHDMILDQIAAGIDPEKVTFYMQSGIPLPEFGNRLPAGASAKPERHGPRCRD